MFVCAGCGAPLSASVREVPYPDEPCTFGHGPELPPNRMQPGTYSSRCYPPRRWEPGPRRLRELPPRDPEGAHYVLAPGDGRGTALIIPRCHIGCWGLDGRDGPNLACSRCAAEVGFRLDDCLRWQETLLIASAVRVVDASDQERSAAPCAPPYPEILTAALRRTQWSQRDAAAFYRDELPG